MKEEGTLKTYSGRYWKIYNEIDGNFEDIAINTFKSGLPTKHGLRKSLMGKPVINLRQLMDWVDKYKSVEEDQQLGKGKDKAIPQERRDFRSDRYNNNQPWRDFVVSQDLLILKWLVQCSENWCTRCWRRLRMNRSSNGQTRWLETP